MRKILPIALSLLIWITSGQSQNLQEKKATVRLSNVSLEEALTIIGISYGVQLSYSDDVVPTQTIINLDIQDEGLTTSLERLLKPYALTFKVTNRNRIILRKIPNTLTQTIRGTVVDAVTRAPIPGATVIIQESNPLIGTTTDESGKFKIDHVPVGRRTVVVSSVGYNTRMLSSLLLGTGKEQVFEVAVFESVTQMDEIVVTGLKNEGIPGEGVAVTSGLTFSVEEAKRYAGSLGDPARMASSFAGVTGASDENNGLVVRGNSPRGILWRVDGIEIPNPNHFATEGSSSGVVSVLSPNVISNSDFLTGAFPSQYGNALSAVFDISLRNGNNETREYSFQTGLSGIETSIEGPFSKQHAASYLANYRYSTLSVLDKLGFDLNEAGQYKDYQDLSFKINYPTATAGTFSFFGIGGKSKSVKMDSTILDNNSSDVGVLGLSYRQMLNGSTYLQTSVSYSGTQISKLREIEGLSAGTFATEESYVKSYSRVLLSVRRRITNRYFIEGGAILSQLRYNFFLKTVNPGDSTYTVVINFSERERGSTYITQGFLYARQYFSSKLFGFYGFHFMNFALTDDYSIEPRAGLRWQLSEDKSISMAYGKHSRIENLQYYLARNHQSGGDEVQINKELGFTRSDHVVLSYSDAFSSHHHFKAEAYYQQLYNAPVQTDPSVIYASINEDSGFISDSLTNKGKGKNYGLELSLEQSFTRNFYYLINTSLFRSAFKVHDETERSTAYDGNYSIHVLGGKEFEAGSNRNRIGLNLKVTQAGGRRYVPIDLLKSIEENRQVHNWSEAFDYQLPAYFRADFQFLYKINRPHYSFELRLDVQNLTNHRNAAWYYYDASDQSVKLRKQVGMVPLLSLRVDF